MREWVTIIDWHDLCSSCGMARKPHMRLTDDDALAHDAVNPAFVDANRRLVARLRSIAANLLTCQQPVQPGHWACVMRALAARRPNDGVSVGQHGPGAYHTAMINPAAIS
jgi:hypothetical protein